MANIQKSYLYKVYKSGVYLGNLPNVTSDFNPSLDINTPGCQITVTCGLTADSADQAPGHILTEASDFLTDESGNRITLSRTPDIVGEINGNTIVANGNSVKVWEFSNTYPNGKLMLNGEIKSWSANFGNDNNETIEVLIYSDGFDLNQVIQQNGGYVVAESSTTANTEQQFVGSDKLNTFGAQTFTATSNYRLGKVSLKIRLDSSTPSGSVTVFIINGDVSTTGGSLMGFVAVNVTNTAAQFVDFAISPSGTHTPDLISGNVYSIVVGTNIGTTMYWEYDNTNPYASGAGYLNSGGVYGAISGDYAFRTYSTAPATTIEYSGFDPTDMISSALADYNSQGGNIVFDSSSNETGESIDYTFVVATTLEVIQKGLAIAPYNWYYYVDLGNNHLYFKSVSTTADYKLTKGVHINNLKIVATIENIVNVLYFSGGDVGSGVNLFTKYSDSDSIATYGQQIDRKSDNRVILQSTADAIGESDIAQNKDENYQTTVVVLDQTMDITLLKPGQTIGFNGFGTLVDNLILQIVRIDYMPEQATLTLGQIPPRQSTTLQQAIADLNNLQTIANPSAPS